MDNSDVIMRAIASEITSLTIVYSIVYSGADQTKHQSSASLAFVRGIHRSPVNSPHIGPVTRKMFPFDDVIRCCEHHGRWQCWNTGQIFGFMYSLTSKLLTLPAHTLTCFDFYKSLHKLSVSFCQDGHHEMRYSSFKWAGDSQLHTMSNGLNKLYHIPSYQHELATTLIPRFMGPTWGPSGADMLAP